MKFSVQKEIKFLYKRVMEDVTVFGSWWFVLFAAVLFVIFNQIEFAIKYFVAAAAFFAIELAIKAVHKKKRPDFKKVKPISWYQGFEQGHAFPSGHTGKITLLTIMLHFNFGMIYFTTLFVIITILVSLSRVYLKRHYWKDLLGGIVLGLIIGFLFS